jgi:hypothetical protein
MKHEIITLSEFADIWENARNHLEDTDIPGTNAKVHALETFDGERVLIVMAGENGVLIRP